MAIMSPNFLLKKANKCMLGIRIKICFLIGMLLGFVSMKSNAECRLSGIDVFPKTKAISSNSIFIVEGFSMSQSVIRHLNKGNPIYLTSGNDTVCLKVLKILEGQFDLTQAILSPVTKLVPGKKYHLNIDSLNRFESLYFEKDSFDWNVSNLADLQKPIWTELPSYAFFNVEEYGCGPSIYAYFDGCFSDNSPVVVYAKVKNLNSNSIHDYYITPSGCSLRLGHGMCSGEFSFRENEEYEVTFSLMDASGNTSNETSPIRFTGSSEQKEEPAGLSWIFFSVGIFAVTAFLLFKIRKNKKTA